MKIVLNVFLRRHPVARTLIALVLSLFVVSVDARSGVCGSDELPYESIPLLSSVSPDELKERLRADLSVNPEIIELRKFAQANHVRLFLFGKTATDAVHLSRIQLLSKIEVGAECSSHFWSFDQIQRPLQSLRMAVTHESGLALSRVEIEKLQTMLSGSFNINGGVPELVGLQVGAGDRLEMNLNLLENPASSFDSFASAYIDLTRIPLPSELGGDSEKNWIGDLTPTVVQNSSFLVALAQGVLESTQFEPALKASMISGEYPVLSVFRLLVQKVRYGLDMDDTLREEIRAIFNEWNPDEIDRETWSALHREGRYFFIEALDFEDAWNTLHYIGGRTKLIREGEITDQESLSFFLSKEPLRSFPHPAQHNIGKLNWWAHHKKAEDLGVQELTHQSSLLSHQVINSHPANKVNGCISRHNYCGENGLHGDGFYTLVGDGHEATHGPKVTTLEISKKALQNEHFVFVNNYKMTADFVRLISSDPNYVRLKRNDNRPLYRPVTLPRTLFGSAAPIPRFSSFGNFMLNCMKKLRK